jgi:sulfatase maturation enzyme AslB (radical SAM superfamily)
VIRGRIFVVIAWAFPPNLSLQTPPGLIICSTTLSIVSIEKSALKTLKRQHHTLADSSTQVSILEDDRHLYHLVPFQQKLEESNLFPLAPTGIKIFQVNVGKMCNQVCKHCHVDAGPDRKEIMTRETMQLCLNALMDNTALKTVDLTGGAPEMNPHFRWFVEEITALKRHVIVRCNLTIILANKKYHDLPQFFAQHGIEVVSSLPFYTKDRTDRQRGDGVFYRQHKSPANAE